jgi:hypothetical protein
MLAKGGRRLREASAIRHAGWIRHTRSTRVDLSQTPCLLPFGPRPQDPKPPHDAQEQRHGVGTVWRVKVAGDADRRGGSA